MHKNTHEAENKTIESKTSADILEKECSPSTHFYPKRHKPEKMFRPTVYNKHKNASERTKHQK